MENVTSMDTVVSSLTTTLSSANLWGTVGSAVPLIGVVVLFALGFRIVKKLLNGESKGKVKVG